MTQLLYDIAHEVNAGIGFYYSAILIGATAGFIVSLAGALWIYWKTR